MKKYKLIKKFPGSPEIGTVVTYYSNWEMYGITNECIYKRLIIENNPEFWQKVEEISVGTKIVDTYPDTKGLTYEKLCNGNWKIGNADYITISEDSIGENKRFQIFKEEVKKEYEILQIKNKYGGNIITFNSEGKPIHRTDGCTISCTLDLKSCLNTKSINIFQVRRLSDSEIFTIGDKVKGYYESVITGFRIDKFSKSGITVYTSSNICQDYNNCCLSYISKVKEPLFITEDGKEVYVDTVVYGIDTKNIIYTGQYCWLDKKYFDTRTSLNKDTKYFSTKEKAEEWIILNKPELSINDVKENFVISEIENGRKVTNGSLTLEKLKELVKSKL